MDYKQSLKFSQRSNYKARFLKIYANIPLNLRNEIVVVIDDQPLSWNAAKIEIENDTSVAKQILDKLVKMQIL